MKQLRLGLIVLFIFTLTLCISCNVPDMENTTESGDQEQVQATETTTQPGGKLILSTTTSFDNTGLLAQILPDFENKTGIDVDVVAVGTGAALELARAGDSDIVLVHAREAEEEFLAEGHGISRNYVAQNEFVIIGPSDDPAGIKEAGSAAEAFEKIFNNESIFVSRGDDSGTHKRELQIWAAANLEPSGEWYVEAGQGMGAVATVTNEMEGYTLIDTGTFYAMEDNLDLVILYSGDPMLLNVYTVIPLNPEMHPDANNEGAVLFVDWITSPEVREMISNFNVNGHVLFSMNEKGYDDPQG